MRKLLIALMIVGLSAGAAQASILGNHLSFDGLEDFFEDDSRGSIYDPTSDGFTVGDVIYGYISISDLTISGNPAAALGSDQIAIAYAVEIIGTYPSTGGPLTEAPFGGFYLGPSTVAGYTVDDLVGPGLKAKVDPLLAPAGVTTADALAIVVSNSGAVDPLAPELVNTVDDMVPAPLFTAPSWSYELTLGFDRGPDGVTNTGDEHDFFL